MRKKILLVDDDEIFLEFIKNALEKKDYEVSTADNGEDGLNKFNKNSYNLVITDIYMPVMDGVQFINNLLLFENKPVIIAQSVQSDMHSVIELMQNGIYDYLLKPYNITELFLKIEKAYEMAELRILKENLEKEREIRNAHILNWNKWKENILKRDQDKIDGNLIGSIRTSFSQGTGIGTLLSTIDILERKSKEKENHYEVNKSLMKFLFENAKSATRIIEVLDEIDRIQTSELELRAHCISEVHKILNTASIQLKDFEKLKNQTLVMCENKFRYFSYQVNINPEYLEKAFKELLLNAIKFSTSNSKIYILFEVKQNSILISFLNTPLHEGDIYGIQPEYSNIIFEPFFRITKLVFESVPTLDFGLGLTMVDKIILRHNGKIRANNLRSYLDTNEDGSPSTLVNFEIEIPISK
ncbi:MAG: response regulator [Leptospiraceae bacterium]|nr:response regulator [Leptospiraceae bacterium]